MLNCDYVELEFPYSKKFSKVRNYDYVKLAKVTKKNAPKILFVLDHMPSEDARSGRLLSGNAGKLLENLLIAGPKFHNTKLSIKDSQWLAMSFNAFKVDSEQRIDKEEAEHEFIERLNYVIVNYKPDVVVTFGLKTMAALNNDYISKHRNKRGVQYQHFYGVPIATKTKYKGKSHKYQHVSTLPMSRFMHQQGIGIDSYMLGYMMRNLLTATNGGKLVYSMPKMEFEVERVDSIESFKAMMKVLRNSKYVAVDTETANLNRRANKTLIIQFAVSTDKAYIVPISHKDSTWRGKELAYVKKSIKDFFEYKNKTKYMLYANACFDLVRLRSDFGVRHFKNDLWDVFAGEFGLDENLKELSSFGGYYYSLLNLCMQYGNRDFYDSEFGKDKRATIEHEDISDALLIYCAMDVISLLHIRKLQLRRAKDMKYDKYESLVGQQISDKLHMFAAMEYHGSLTDMDWLFYLHSKESPLLQHRDAVVKALKKSDGVRKANELLTKQAGASSVGLFGKTTLNIFSINKPAHAGILMFDVLKLKPTDVNKNGQGKIDKTFQSKYADVKEVALYNELQKVKKIHSSYVKAFIQQWGIDEDMRSDNCIRPHYGFVDVVTGRSSAKKPSLHQLPSRNSVTAIIAKMFPKRADLGSFIKRLFIAGQGRLILKIDFSAHEVRCFSLESYVSTIVGMIKFKDLIAMVVKPKVRSFNHATQQDEYKDIGTQSVHPTSEDMYEITYEGGVITVTGNHEIWSEDRQAYVRADCLAPGERLHAPCIETVTVISIRNIKTPEYVCDLGIEDNHNLYVCDTPDGVPVLAHNCWSLISNDMKVANLFQHGLDMRTAYKLFPFKDLSTKISLEGDVHKINAAYFFSMAIDKVDKAKRDSVKQVIFGLIYQQGIKGVAKSTGQTVEVITKLIAAFFKRFPVGAGWFNVVKDFAKRHFFVESPLGRRRNLWPFLLPRQVENANSIHAAAERRGVNSPVQGLGSDFLDMGSREIEKNKWKHLEETGHYPDFYTTNSVHDSLEFSVAYEDVWKAIKIIEHGLTTGVKEETVRRHGIAFTVDLEIDFEIGANLRDCGAWDFSIDKANGKNSFETLLRQTLEFQRDTLKYDVDVDAVYDQICHDQYDDMPDWAKKQMWNTGKQPKNVTDPRSKQERLNESKIRKTFEMSA